MWLSKFTPAATAHIGGALQQANITSAETIEEVIQLTLSSLLERIAEVPGVAGNETLYNAVVRAGQVAYAESYKYVYYTSVAFGVVSIAAALLMGDISRFMDDHVAVVM